jgi:CcmD family protein|tara:strand:- start:365 stop:541 length:177 start_codon:yes stop_codon:yes gene_type:complete
MMTNPGYLFAGFALAWGLVLVYLWFLSRRSAVVQKELETLEQRLNKAKPQDFGNLREK